MLSHLLDRAIRRSNALDTESLCILAGQKCWNIRADVHILDFDGGLVDGSCIAVMAALKHFRRPDVTVHGDSITIHSLADRTPVPLSLLHCPICVTLSFFKGGDTVVVDATRQEQQVSDGEMVVTANAQSELCQIAKLGGIPMDPLLLLRCLELAAQKSRELSEIMTKALETDEVSRNPKKQHAELQAKNQR